MTPSLRFGCQVAHYGDVAGTVELAVAVEEAGFDAVSLPDHLFHPTGTEDFLADPPWEAFTVLGALAAETESVELLPGVADSVRRHPAVLAHTVATLDRLSGGRTALGLGAGEAFNIAPVPDFEWAPAYTRFRECLDVVTGLWASTADDPLTVDGECFHLDRAHMGFEPERDPPVYVGGYGPKMRALTGRRADGWFPWIHAPDPYAADRERVDAAAAEAGRDPDDVAGMLMVPTCVSEDGAAAREAARERTRANLALRPALLAALGHPDLAEAAPPMREMAYDPDQRERLTDVAGRIPDDAVDEVVVAGTPEEAVADLERFAEAGVTFPVVIPVGDAAETLSHYEETILPRLS
ncbi:MAG: LLM class flavin-dependent oxidoreductase [Halobacteriaceae archaeon]